MAPSSSTLPERVLHARRLQPLAGHELGEGVHVHGDTWRAVLGKLTEKKFLICKIMTGY